MTATSPHPDLTALHYGRLSLFEYGVRLAGGVAGAAVLAVSAHGFDEAVKADDYKPPVSIERPATPAGGTIMAEEQIRQDVGRDHRALAAEPEASRFTFLKSLSD